jgi:hypothetical protein
MNKYRLGFLSGFAGLLLLTAADWFLFSTATHQTMGIPGEFWQKFGQESDFSWLHFLMDMAFLAFLSHVIGRWFDDPEYYAEQSQRFRRIWGDRDVADSIDLMKDRDKDLK